MSFLASLRIHRPSPLNGADRRLRSTVRTVLEDSYRQHRTGDPIVIRCHGGPRTSRPETFPPRFEVAVKGGLYVLLDEGPIADWKYQFVPSDH
jgi:hypothetical protein